MKRKMILRIFPVVFFIALLFIPIKHLKTGDGTTLQPITTICPTNKKIATPAPTLDLYSRSPNLPYNKLFITKERKKYKTGDLTLIIPKLSLKEPVQNGTDTTSLNRAPSLYVYAQLPGEGDRNVSIAAHRNKSRNGIISEWFFYYIDTLCEDDYIYLTDSTKIYRYRYDQTTIVEEKDWSPIYSQGVSCITLTSCEPIGVATHRIIVRAILDDISPKSKDYVYHSCKNDY